MKSISTKELLGLAQIPNPKEKLQKMSYLEISEVMDKLNKTINLVRDCRLLSILLQFKHHVVMCEKQLRQKELQKIHRLSSLQEIVSYIAEIENKEMMIYA